MSDLASLSNEIRKRDFLRIHFCFDNTIGFPISARKYRLHVNFTHRMSLACLDNSKKNQLCDILENKNIELSDKSSGDCRMLIVIEGIDLKRDANIYISEGADFIFYEDKQYYYPDRNLKTWLIAFCRKYFDSKY